MFTGIIESQGIIREVVELDQVAVVGKTEG
jgi:hypothetical protein